MSYDCLRVKLTEENILLKKERDLLLKKVKELEEKIIVLNPFSEVEEAEMGV
jgi:hypothetical protein